MHHFLTSTLQYVFIVAFALAIPSQLRNLIGTIRLGRKSDTLRLTPRWKDALYFAGMGIGTWIGIVIYGYWGWDTMVSLMRVLFIPMMLLTMFMSMNAEVYSQYNLERLGKGRFSLLERAMLFVMVRIGVISVEALPRRSKS